MNIIGLNKGDYFKVGMGQSPDIPDHLSQEGKDFLGRCFVHLPEDRASAQDLLSHNFTKVRKKYW